MVDSIKIVVKWLIVVIIFLIVVFVIAKLSDNSNKNTNKPLSQQVKIIEPETNENIETPINEENEDEKTNEEITTPDTGTTAIKEMLIGIIILSGTTYYIYKNKKLLN